MADATTTQAFTGRTDEAFVLRLRGPIRYPNAQALRAFVDDVLLEEREATVVLDLRDVTFVDSTGLGLIARVGREVLGRTARRAVIVCHECDVSVTLRAAAFDDLFIMTEAPPFGEPTSLVPVTLKTPRTAVDATGLGRVILDAHRDLAALSERNRLEYREVIERLEAELGGSGGAGGS